jgi:glycosyltransferase involved in cell wall biosynthesis
MRTAFLTSDLQDPSARLRILQYIPLLKEAGLTVEALEIPRSGRLRWSFFRRLGRFDVVVVHRKLFAWLELAFLRRNASILVFDFDDALMVRVPWRGRTRSRVRAARFRRIVARADALIPGSSHLQDLADAPGKPTLLLPTPVDLTGVPPCLPAREEGLCLGWIGQKSSLPYLEQIGPALRELCTRNPKLTLRIIADGEIDLQGVRIERVPWKAGSEWSDLGEIDVGLAPLTDDSWSRGKCAFKVLQYFAVSRPVVASPVGMNAEVVRHGETGFCARTQTEWVDFVEKLLADQELRGQMGAAGRLLVESSYSLAESASNMAFFLKNLVVGH